MSNANKYPRPATGCTLIDTLSFHIRLNLDTLDLLEDDGNVQAADDLVNEVLDLQRRRDSALRARRINLRARLRA